MHYLFWVKLLILEYNEGKHFKLFTRLIFSSSFSQVSFGFVSQPWVGRKSYQAIRVRDWNSTGARYLSGIWLFIASSRLVSFFTSWTPTLNLMWAPRHWHLLKNARSPIHNLACLSSKLTYKMWVFLPWRPLAGVGSRLRSFESFSPQNCNSSPSMGRLPGRRPLRKQSNVSWFILVVTVHPKNMTGLGKLVNIFWAITAPL